jgi:hypothetical protein
MWPLAPVGVIKGVVVVAKSGFWFFGFLLAAVMVAWLLSGRFAAAGALLVAGFFLLAAAAVVIGIAWLFIQAVVAAVLARYR